MGGGPPGQGGKEDKDKKVRIVMNLRIGFSDCLLEGEAKVRTSSTTDHPHWTEEAQASWTQCRCEAAHHLSYCTMQVTVSEDAESA